MKKLKKISIFFLLIVLTCYIVFLPQLISGQSKENLLNEIVYRNYTAGNRPKPTSEQVARLYCNREISIDYNSSPVISENSDTQAIRENVIDLVEMLFEKDETVCNPIKNILTGGSISYYRNSRLIKIDNQPTALNFVNYSIKNEGSRFSIIYEEKTKTIIRLACDVFEKNFESIKDTNLHVEKAVSMIKNYFEKQLSCSPDEYFFTADVLPYTDGEKGDFVNIIIACDLMQSDDNTIEG